MNTTQALCQYDGPALLDYKFTGKERDTETGLDWFSPGRYYGSSTARFVSTDPLNVPILQSLKPSKFAKFISDPQNWNQYSYTRNNPLNSIDPDGFLTVVISGTWSNLSDWEKSQFMKQVQKQFGEKPIILGWARGNNKKDRQEAAARLGALIEGHKGEKINVVTHSHGGNIAFLASQTHNIDTLVTLGVPVRPDYKPNEANIGQHINVFSPFDDVQTRGGGDHNVLGYGSGRLVDGAVNAESGYAKGHSELWAKPETWDKVVVPLLKK